MTFIGLYYVIINLFGFAITGIDKYKAKHHKWRIPERTLYSIALIGGGIGVYVSMQTFRHKTKHTYFIYGVPLLIIIHGIILYNLI